MSIGPELSETRMSFRSSCADFGSSISVLMNEFVEVISFTCQNYGPYMISSLRETCLQMADIDESKTSRGH